MNSYGRIELILALFQRPTMPRRSARGGQVTMADMTRSSIEEVVATAHEHSIRNSSLEGYYSEGRKLMDIITASSKAQLRRIGITTPPSGNLQNRDMALYLGKHVSEEFFTSYCGARAEKGQISIPKTRVALLKFQQMAKATPWARRQDIVDLVRGLEVKAAEKYDETMRGPVRGAITQPMLTELQEYIKSHHEDFKPKISKEVATDIAETMSAQFGAALRIKELVNLTAACITADGLMLARVKQHRAISAKRNQPVYKHIKKWPSGLRAWKILARRAKERPHGLLFDKARWNMRKYNAVIRQAAVAIGLRCRFVLDLESSHCLRHGGIGQAQTEMRQKWTLSQELEALRLSKRMSKFYGRPNEER